jgi:hypothetical protein
MGQARGQPTLTLKGAHYAGMNSNDDAGPKAIDLCLGAADEGITLVVSYMDRL